MDYDKILKYLKTTLIILIILLVLSLIYFNVLEPSYMSYAGVCKNIKTEDYGYFEAGNLTKESETITISINQNLPKKIQERSLRHEIIHYHQIVTRNITVTCNNLFFLELEAYTFQYLPDRIFYLIYPKIKENC